MITPNIFKIYNASAGSGKTYTLVKEYLLLLLQSNQPDSYRNILAITFTNKAVAEMKTRVIAALDALSKEECPPTYQSLLNDLVEKTSSSEEVIKEKSRKVLKSILHNYASFDISTIDRFTQKVIRTFAKDLGIPVNFEVELNTLQVLQEAVDRLINRAGEDKELTKVLINFTLAKTDDDKSWDIARDLFNFSRILLHETHHKYLVHLQNKKLEDYLRFSEKLKQHIKAAEDRIAAAAEDFFKIIDDEGLERLDFNRGYVYDYYKKTGAKNYKVPFGAGWQENIDNDKLYAQKLSQAKKDILDHYHEEIALLFKTSRAAIFKREYLKEVDATLTPLSLLSEIATEMEHIKKERSLVLISDFNPTIAAQVKDQPAPFIYERLGERYRNYFIDEFQDTSEMQWQNIIPLIDHALSSEAKNNQASGLTLVGDAKQSIYRFRGGKAEQFIDLYNDINPFGVDKEVENLPYNYRSAEEIVKFNNSFFGFVANKFNKPSYRELFKGSSQMAKKDEPGYINISFHEVENSQQELELHPQKVHEIIVELENQGSLKGDICILTRTRKQSFTIANYLSGKGISIVSSESLLVSNSPEVGFINDMLEFTINPEDKNLRWNLLDYLVKKLKIDEPHQIFKSTLELKEKDFFSWLETYDIRFNLQHIRELSIYEAAEEIIRKFDLIQKSDAYLQFYLDFIFEKTTKAAISITEFLELWEQQKEKLSIVAPKTNDAVQIMTIHKSKGLEFPVVIYPFANTKLRDISKEHLWLPLPEELAEVPMSYFRASKKMLNWGEIEKQAYEELLSQTEFDAINILYVAFTRASSKLFILSCYDFNKNGEEYDDRVSGLLIGYLKQMNKWTGEHIYEIGVNTPTREKGGTDSASHPQNYFSSPTQNEAVRIVTRSGNLWGSKQEEAINLGILVHNILSETGTLQDLPAAIAKFSKNTLQNNQHEKDLHQLISRVISHPGLQPFYKEGADYKREVDIISPGGEILRPDRINFNGNRVTIIDYKTGEARDSHKEQMQQYETVLKQMGFDIDQKILIYFNKEVNITFV